MANGSDKPENSSPATSEPAPADGTPKRTSGYINSTVTFAKHDMLMHDVVKEMIDKKISSVLVEDDKGSIIGIITERDIVRKFTLLEVEDKLNRTVATIMSRPVEFVQVKDVHKQIIKLHLEKRIRHFPVLSSKDPKKENLIGIVSITDVVRNYMMEELSGSGKSGKPAADSSDGKKAAVKPLVGVMAVNQNLTNTYLEIFRGLGFSSEAVSDAAKFSSASDATQRALILDLDGFHDAQVHEILPVVVKSNVFLVLTTSKHSLVPIFKRHLNRSHQEIAMKPLDIGYLSWLMQKHWATE